VGDELDLQVKVAVRNRKRNLKKRYRFARTLGFSAVEAGVVCQWSKKRILNLAKERGYQIPSNTEVD